MADTRGRVRDRAAQAQQQGRPGTDVADARVPTGATIAQRIEEMTPRLAAALPRGVEARQLVRDAMACIRTTPHLGEADPVTVMGALMTCAQLGLRPGVLGQAWILPYWNKRERKYLAQFIAGYRGLAQLGYRHPSVSRINVRAVFPGDEFYVEYGYDEVLRHKPFGPREGAPEAFYSVWRHVNGGGSFLSMTAEEMRQWRDRYAPRNRDGGFVGPWAKPEDDDQRIAMGLKTPLRRMSALMPMNADFVTALAADGGVRREVDPEARPEEVTVFDPDLDREAPGTGTDAAGGDVVDGDDVEDDPALADDPTTDPGWRPAD